jgi:hypothetical protein
VFAGTGDKGTIYKIAPDGKGAVFYQTKATHAMTLAFDREGRLLAGTGSPGRVFRLDASGKPFVLFDSSYSRSTSSASIRPETSTPPRSRAVRAAAGAAATTPALRRPASPVPVATVTTEITVGGRGDASVSARRRRPAAAPSGPTAGAVFRINPDGSTDVLWETREDTPYDLAFEPGGTVLVGTGGKGKLFRLTGDPARATLVARADAQQVTTLATDRNGQVLFATSNPGKLFRLSAAARRSRHVHVRGAGRADGGHVGRHQVAGAGAAGTRVEVATRSGNTKTPDEGVERLEHALRRARREPDYQPARPLSAVARRARGGSPHRRAAPHVALRGLSAAQRTPARDVDHRAHARHRVSAPLPHRRAGDCRLRRRHAGPAAAAQLQGSAGAGPNIGRRAYEKGLLTFIWRAEDENRDDLVYELQYRREGETAWHSLKQALTDAIFVWDTTSVPNGRYTVRVVASDAPSNSASTALTGDLESTAFDIDNTPPVITVTAVRRDGARSTLLFDVRDDNSAVQKVEYSLDGDRWQAVYPKDGIADSRFEQYELTVPETQGTLGVVLRAADALNNVSSTRGVTAGAASGGR